MGLLIGVGMLNQFSGKRTREQEEHEQFIAHEIHDGACQYAAAAQMMFDTFRGKRADALSGDWKSFDIGMELLKHANEELRRLVCGLRPIQLAAGDLPTAIDYLIKEIQTAGGPEIKFNHDIQTDGIPPRLELAAFRIVQEALVNACRHSKSKKILVGLIQKDDSVCIRVQDWGVGFDPQNIPNGHFGLEGIRRRVRLLNGIATIHSSLHEGTLISVELPKKE